MQQELNRRTKAEDPDRVQAAAFVSSGIGQQLISAPVVVEMRDVAPAELSGLDLVQYITRDVQQSTAFRAEHPFMAIRRQGVNLRLPYVQRKGSQTLNRIDEKQAAMT